MIKMVHDSILHHRESDVVLTRIDHSRILQPTILYLGAGFAFYMAKNGNSVGRVAPRSIKDTPGSHSSHSSQFTVLSEFSVLGSQHLT